MYHVTKNISDHTKNHLIPITPPSLWLTKTFRLQDSPQCDSALYLLSVGPPLLLLHPPTFFLLFAASLHLLDASLLLLLTSALLALLLPPHLALTPLLLQVDTGGELMENWFMSQLTVSWFTFLSSHMRHRSCAFSMVWNQNLHVWYLSWYLSFVIIIRGRTCTSNQDSTVICCFWKTNLTSLIYFIFGAMTARLFGINMNNKVSWQNRWPSCACVILSGWSNP